MLFGAVRGAEAGVCLSILEAGEKRGRRRAARPLEAGAQSVAPTLSLPAWVLLSLSAHSLNLCRLLLCETLQRARAQGQLEQRAEEV